MIEASIYERKIKLLEQEISHLLDQLTFMRQKYRVAEDFQIKYELLQRQIEQDNLRNKKIQKEQQVRREQYLAIKLKQNNGKVQKDMQDLQNRLKQKYFLEIEKIKEQKSDIQKRYNELSTHRQQIQIFNFKLKKLQKQNEALHDQLQQMKKYYEKQKEEELNLLKSHLNNNFRQKLSGERKKYEQKIDILEKQLNQSKANQDIQSIILPSSNNNEIVKLKQLLEQKNKEHQQEIDKLDNLLSRKNDQIKLLLQQRLQREQSHNQQINQKRRFIVELEDKLFQKQKDHEQQIFNLIERSKAAKDQAVRQLEKQIQRLNGDLEKEHLMWKQKILNHDQEVQILQQQFEQQKRKMIEDKNNHKKKISQLSSRLKELEGQRQIGETQMLINSLKDIDSKQDHLGSYENGITFLERQNKKCALKLEEKNRLVTKLQKQINELKNQTEQQINELKQKHKQEKKSLTSKVLSLEYEVRELSDRVRAQQRDLRKRQKDTSNQRIQLQTQNRALKDFVDQLQRDYNRVIENKKNVETNYREERQRGITSKGDVNLIKKQKWLQLQKQKNQLQIIFREKQQQLKIQYQSQIDNKTNQLIKIKQKFEVVDKENQILKRQNQKLNDLLEINKQNNKIAEYNKKMATLNLEIALTQNIYDSIIKAKSRVQSYDSMEEQHSFGEIPFGFNTNNKLQEENRDYLLLSFNPGSQNLK